MKSKQHSKIIILHFSKYIFLLFLKRYISESICKDINDDTDRKNHTICEKEREKDLENQATPSN